MTQVIETITTISFKEQKQNSVDQGLVYQLQKNNQTDAILNSG